MKNKNCVAHAQNWFIINDSKNKKQLKLNETWINTIIIYNIIYNFIILILYRIAYREYEKWKFASISYSYFSSRDNFFIIKYLEIYVYPFYIKNMYSIKSKSLNTSV